VSLFVDHQRWVELDIPERVLKKKRLEVGRPGFPPLQSGWPHHRSPWCAPPEVGHSIWVARQSRRKLASLRDKSYILRDLCQQRPKLIEQIFEFGSRLSDLEFHRFSGIDVDYELMSHQRPCESI
jgi:hypothetical protein